MQAKNNPRNVIESTRKVSVLFRFLGVRLRGRQPPAFFPHGLAKEVFNLGVDTAKFVLGPGVQVLPQVRGNTKQHGFFLVGHGVLLTE